MITVAVGLALFVLWLLAGFYMYSPNVNAADKWLIFGVAVYLTQILDKADG